MGAAEDTDLALGTGCSVHLLCDGFEVDPAKEIHLSGVDAKNVHAGGQGWVRKLDLAVDTPGPEQGVVQDIDAVRGHDDLAYRRGTRDEIGRLRGLER